jgi:hypothetical protein
MDAKRVDTLARQLGQLASRRTAAVGLGFVWGGLGAATGAAKRSRKKGKKRRCPACAPGRVRVPGSCACCLPHGASCETGPGCCTGACVETAIGGRICLGRAWQQACRFGGECASGSCAGVQCAASCFDGEQNGNETAIDCGGSCSRCGDGRTCLRHSDCQGARCAAGACNACSTEALCLSDDRGPCFCLYDEITAQNVCTRGAYVEVASCAQCGGDRVCYDNSPFPFWCIARCGAP